MATQPSSRSSKTFKATDLVCVPWQSQRPPTPPTAPPGHKCTHESKLLFSGGGRAQLKAWRIHFEVEPSHENSCGHICKPQQHLDGSDGASDPQDQEWNIWSEHLGTHLLCAKGLKHCKPWKSHLYDASAETRYMALTTFCLVEFSAELPQELHVIAAACSDGFVRSVLVHSLWPSTV